MPVPPPLPDPSHLETRLLIMVELLDRVVVEARRAIDDLRADTDTSHQPDPPGGPDEQ